MTDPLWDPRVPHTDDELAELEASLGALAYRGSLPELPARVPETRRPSRVRWGAWLGVVGLAAAAALFVMQMPEAPPAVPPTPTVADAPTPWEVSTLSGPSVCPDEPCRLVPGAWLETGSDSTALVVVADIGWMEVGPHSRLRLIATSTDRHHLELAQGQVRAAVNAPPEVLIVDTPNARAVDLGCQYTLQVDAGGDGSLEVQSGAVALVRDGEEVVVPAAAQAPIWSVGGPGLPYFKDASAELVAALASFERLPDSASAAAVVAAARPADELSVFWAWARAPADAAPILQGWLVDRHGTGPTVRPFLHADWKPRSPELVARMTHLGWWTED